MIYGLSLFIKKYEYPPDTSTKEFYGSSSLKLCLEVGDCYWCNSLKWQRNYPVHFSRCRLWNSPVVLYSVTDTATTAIEKPDLYFSDSSFLQVMVGECLCVPLTFSRRGRRSRWHPWRRGERIVWCRPPGRTSGCCTSERSWCDLAPPVISPLFCWPAATETTKSLGIPTLTSCFESVWLKVCSCHISRLLLQWRVWKISTDWLINVCCSVDGDLIASSKLIPETR